MNATPPCPPSLFQYLHDAHKKGVVHHALGVMPQSDGGYHFYIHPAQVSGETEDYLIWPDPFVETTDLLMNKKRVPEPDVNKFLASLKSVPCSKGDDKGNNADMKCAPDPKEPPCPNATPASTCDAVTVYRERLGEVVRNVWIDWAKEQLNPKPSWLLPWDKLAEPDREVDRRIGETLFRLGQQDAPTAPRPTTDYAGLVERLEKSASIFVPDSLVRQNITDAIAALTQLAGEVQRLEKELGGEIEDYMNARMCCNGTDCGCGGVTRLQQYVQEEAGMELDSLKSERDDLRQKLAASERDAEALAGACEKVKTALHLWDGGLTSGGHHWQIDEARNAVNQALAHRARGAAGEKK